MEEKFRVQRVWRYHDGIEQAPEWTIKEVENDVTRHGRFFSEENCQKICNMLNSGTMTLEEMEDGFTIWIARDKSGELFGYKKEPVLHEDGMWSVDNPFEVMAVIPDKWYPTIKPGECKKFMMQETNFPI